MRLINIFISLNDYLCLLAEAQQCKNEGTDLTVFNNKDENSKKKGQSL